MGGCWLCGCCVCCLVLVLFSFACVLFGVLLLRGFPCWGCRIVGWRMWFGCCLDLVVAVGCSVVAWFECLLLGLVIYLVYLVCLRVFPVY